jgi:hypothetical protein
MNRRIPIGVGAALCLVAGSLAQAHFVWLERDAAGPARGYFGEWNNDLMEKTGGALDRIATPRAFQRDAGQSLPITRAADHMDVAVSAAGDVRLTDSVINAQRGTNTSYYAKAGRSETAGVMAMEIVPTSSNGNTLQVLWHGAPLKKQEVEVYGPPKWQKTFTTDDTGQVTITTPWKGRYVLEAIHSEEATEAGKPAPRHIATLSFTVARGPAAP